MGSLGGLFIMMILIFILVCVVVTSLFCLYLYEGDSKLVCLVVARCSHPITCYLLKNMVLGD